MNDTVIKYSQIAPGLINIEKLVVDSIDLLGLDGQQYVNSNYQSNGAPNEGDNQGQTTGQGNAKGASTPTSSAQGVAVSPAGAERM